MYSSPPLIRKFRTTDVDEYMAILEQNHAPALARPAFAASFEMKSHAIFTGGLCFSRNRWSSETGLEFVHVYDGYGLSLPMTGFMRADQAGRNCVETKQGFGVMLDSGMTLKATMAENTGLHRISIGVEDMHARLAALTDRPVRQRIQFSPQVDLNKSTGLMAASLMNLIFRGLEGPAPLLSCPAALTSLREAAMNLILEGIPHSYSELLGRKARLPSPGSVKRAMDYMAANASQPMRLADVANAAGVSARSLQTGFAQFQDTTPMAYLRTLRLKGVRAELSVGRAGMTVSDVAHAWGFFHMSSFASLYLREFGESPSVTLRRAARA